MKSIIIKLLMILTGFMLLISLSGCGDNDSDGISSERNLLYSAANLPIFPPNKPVDPTDPEHPIEPTDPENPIEPTDPENTIPVANAGVDQNIAVPTLITLDGSQSYDADGDVLTYQWTLKEKPVGSSAILQNATSVNPSFTADIEGLYRAELIVNDGKADSPADSVFITFNSPIPPNQPPVAVAEGPTYVIVKRNAPKIASNILLDGTNSSDDGQIQPLNYTWSSGTHSVPEPKVYLNASCTDDYLACAEDKEHPVCTYKTNLEVFDGEFSDSQSLTTTVDYSDCVEIDPPSPANLPPIAVAQAHTEIQIRSVDTSIIVNQDETIILTLDGTESYDQDTLIQPITYTWRAGAYIVHESTAVGFVHCQNDYTHCASDLSNPICNYNFNLEVFDGELSDNDNVAVSIDYSNCLDEGPPPCTGIPSEKPIEIYITNNPETVVYGTDVQLHLWGVYFDGCEYDITYEPATVWSSLDKSIAPIGTKTGIVHGKEVGTATIEAKHRSDGTDSTVTSQVNVIAARKFF